jgi:hypothetical protein
VKMVEKNEGRAGQGRPAAVQAGQCGGRVLVSFHLVPGQ